MFINAQIPEELRIAILNDESHLEIYRTEAAEHDLTRGNIYRGVITSIRPSLNAAFIDYGDERNGLLSMQDIVSDAYYQTPEEGKRPRIEEVLQVGKPIVVQVTKEPEGTKGSALTTNLSLAGRYLVWMPFDDTRGISRKVEDPEIRQRLKELAGALELPAGGGVIVRTNALDQNKAALSRDLNALLRLWKQTAADARKGNGTKLLYSDQDLIVQTLRDYLDTSINEVLIDDDEALKKAEAYKRTFMPRSRTKLVRYTQRTPLFTEYKIDAQIDSIYERKVSLASGGSIVIEPTEALTTIDVNSGKARANTQEETALQTNTEAAREVARQLVLRDLGGLVVVDFIDMRAHRNQTAVVKALRDAMKTDKARSNVGRVSPNGLVEINRQRLQKALHLRTHRDCPTCEGSGRVPSPELLGHKLLRQIAARASATPTRRVDISLHPEVAQAVQNSRRQKLADLEREFGMDIVIEGTYRLSPSEVDFQWTSGTAEKRPLRKPKQPETKAKTQKAAAETSEDESTPQQEVKPARKSRRSRRRKRQKAARSGQPQGQAVPSQGHPQAFETQPTQSTPTIPPDPETQPLTNESRPVNDIATPGGKKSSRRRGRSGGNGQGRQGNHSHASQPPAVDPATSGRPDPTRDLEAAVESLRKRRSPIILVDE